MLKITKPRLLIVGNTLETFGGGERWVLETSVLLKDLTDITIINPTSPNDVKRTTKAELAKKYRGTYSVIDVPCGSMHVSRGNFLMMFPGLAGLSRLKNAIRDSDVVYELSMNPLILLNSLIFSKIYGKRLILDMGNPLLLREDKLPELRQSLLFRSLQRILLSMVRELHVQTESQLRMVRKYGYKGKSHYVPHYVYSVPGKLQHSRNKNFKVLFVGRLDVWQKGVDLLAKVVTQTLRKDRSIAFELAGSGQGAHILTNLASQHKANVRYHGFVKDSELNELYAKSDLFIITSRYETPGLALLEAQAHGLPAVGFNAQGPSDIIQDPIQGKLVKPFDIEAFADAIISERGRIGLPRRERIRALISRKYSTKTFTERFMRMVKGG